MGCCGSTTAASSSDAAPPALVAQPWPPGVPVTTVHESTVVPGGTSARGYAVVPGSATPFVAKPGAANASAAGKAFVVISAPTGAMQVQPQQQQLTSKQPAPSAAARPP